MSNIETQYYPGFYVEFLVSKDAAGLRSIFHSENVAQKPHSVKGFLCCLESGQPVDYDFLAISVCPLCEESKYHTSIRQ